MKSLLYATILTAALPYVIAQAQLPEKMPEGLDSFELMRYYDSLKCHFYDPPDKGPDPKDECKDICGEEEARKYAEGGGFPNVNCIRWGPGEKEPPWESFRGDHNPDASIKVIQGTCKCNLDIISDLGKFFIECAILIGQIGCQVWLSALTTVVEWGLQAIPGVGQGMSAAMRGLIQAAKAFDYAYEKGSAAAEFAGAMDDGWAKACGGPSIGITSLTDIFNPLSQVPDNVVPLPDNPGGIGRGSRRPGGNNNNDENNNNNDNNGPSNKPDESKKPDETKTAEETKTADQSSEASEQSKSNSDESQTASPTGTNTEPMTTEESATEEPSEEPTSSTCNHCSSCTRRKIPDNFQQQPLQGRQYSYASMTVGGQPSGVALARANTVHEEAKRTASPKA